MIMDRRNERFFSRPSKSVSIAVWLILSLVAFDLHAASEIAGTASVIDGDTIEIHGQRVRLHGIDAPENSQLCERDGERYRCGRAAAFALADLIGRKPVACSPTGRDRYQRIIAVCFQAGIDLNDWLVRMGHALAYRKYSKAYVGAEDEARRSQRGMWAGRFVEPWQWRRGVRL